MLHTAALAGRLRLCLGRTFTSIPVLDVAALVDEAATDKEQDEVGRALHQACRDVGFFYVRNHGVPESVSKGVRDEARHWFSQQEDIKSRIALSPEKYYRGYQRIGSNVTRYGESFQRDWHEAIDFYHEVPPNQAQAHGLRDSAIHGPNQWPADQPAFVDALKSYVDHMNTLGAAIMRGVARGLHLSPDFFDNAHQGDPYWCMRVIHYPPLPDDEIAQASASGSGQGSDGSSPCGSSSGVTAADALAGADVPRATRLSCGEHSDYGLLTLVNQDAGIAALQVKNAQGQWITAEPKDGTFVCNIGDMMRVWTNGLYVPTLHRVINPDPERVRVSVPFFFEPGFETVVRPVLGLDGSSLPPRLAARHYGSHLERKVFSNFEL